MHEMVQDMAYMYTYAYVCVCTWVFPGITGICVEIESI